jgi:transposase-like protein
MGKQCRLDVVQRVEIVLMMLRRDEPIATLARRYNVSETTLHRWREEFLAGGRSALADRRSKKPNSQASEITRLKKELSRRDQVIGEITIANRILKKSADDLL